MKRKIDNFLLHWKNEENRKPLIIYGSKGVGKTYTSILFGVNNYKDIVYIDCEDEENVLSYLKKENNYEGFIKSLEEYSKKIITKNETLLIMDNVNSEEIVNYFRSFGKFKTDYHIILISSSKNNINKFKGIEFQFKSMFPMDFEEFLKAFEKDELVDFIKLSFKNNTKNPFHSLANEYFEKYLETGGMPEAVALFLRGENSLLLNSVYGKVIDSYKSELLNNTNLIDIERSNEVFDSIAKQLSKSNKKFQYGFIKDGGRSKEYEESLNFLNSTGLIYKSSKLKEIKSPLSSYRDKDNFKVYYIDHGFLNKRLYLNDKKVDDYRMILYENILAASLIEGGYTLQYYQSQGKAEIDFVIQSRGGNIIPIELVPHNKTKSKAMGEFLSKNSVKEAIRVTNDNFKVRNGIRYIPIYASFCFDEII